MVWLYDDRGIQCFDVRVEGRNVLLALQRWNDRMNRKGPVQWTLSEERPAHGPPPVDIWITTPEMAEMAMRLTERHIPLHPSLAVCADITDIASADDWIREHADPSCRFHGGFHFLGLVDAFLGESELDRWVALSPFSPLALGRFPAPPDDWPEPKLLELKRAILSRQAQARGASGLWKDSYLE